MYVAPLCFSPQYALFAESPNERLLYPNPASDIVGSNAQFQFLGRLLGKAVYEGLLVEPQFAAFFLNKLLGRPNLVDDLASLDPQVSVE